MICLKKPRFGKKSARQHRLWRTIPRRSCTQRSPARGFNNESIFQEIFNCFRTNKYFRARRLTAKEDPGSGFLQIHPIWEMYWFIKSWSSKRDIRNNRMKSNLLKWLCKDFFHLNDSACLYCQSKEMQWIFSWLKMSAMQTESMRWFFLFVLKPTLMLHNPTQRLPGSVFS